MNKAPDDIHLRAIHARRLLTRDIDELIGVCKAALFDGHIDQMEAEGILAWLYAHTHCLNTWPANILFERLRSMLADGQLDDNESRELLALVMRIAQPETTVAPAFAALPIDDPAPTIEFTKKRFCFTGIFEYGPRAACQEAVVIRGGEPSQGITKRLHYLVIGSIGSEFWRHSTFGEKIAKAVRYRESGVPVIIITEAHWAAAL